MKHHCRRRAVLLCLLLAAWAPPAAWAQEEGVTIDPGAPASKEYALPLDSAREAASGSSGGPGKRSARRFGDGITPDQGPAARIREAQRRKADRTGGPSTGSRQAPERAGGIADGAQTAQSAANPETRRLLAESGTGSDGTAAMALGGAAVLVMALGGGLLWRRRGEEPMS